jgi:hypothetical protein
MQPASASDMQPAISLTLTEVLHEWVNHDLGHLRQIAELYRAHAFHPYSGTFMKYSNPQP